MKNLFNKILLLVAVLGLLTAPVVAQTADGQTVVFAGGCFWGMQSVFEHVKGVTKVTAGYAGGDAATANYETVSSGTTKHAESVQVVYDPKQVSFEDLLKVYFTVAHDPTELNYQGPDHGTQYRSEIFYTTPEQKQAADAMIAKMQGDKVFKKPVVTQTEPLTGFYPAEDYHQDYARTHPYNPYILINDAPKVAALKKSFPQFYTDGS